MNETEKGIAEDLLKKISAAQGDTLIQLIHAYNVFLEAVQRRVKIEKGGI